MEPVKADIEASQFLSFFVGEEEFGIGILEAREIIQYAEVTKVPAMPPAIRSIGPTALEDGARMEYPVL